MQGKDIRRGSLKKDSEQRQNSTLASLAWWQSIHLASMRIHGSCQTPFNTLSCGMLPNLDNINTNLAWRMKNLSPNSNKHNKIHQINLTSHKSLTFTAAEASRPISCQRAVIEDRFGPLFHSTMATLPPLSGPAQTWKAEWNSCRRQPKELWDHKLWSLEEEIVDICYAIIGKRILNETRKTYLQISIFYDHLPLNSEFIW